MDEENRLENALNLGTWLGRKQAFGLMAGHCSAADAECLRTLRDEKRYVALGMTWEEFCKDKVGVSRQTAERVIRNLEEFGPRYFELASVVRIAPEQYRQIAAAVTEDGISCGGEVIEISVENTPRLAEAVDTLRQQAERARPVTALPTAEGSLACARKAFGHALDQWVRAWELTRDPVGRDSILRELEQSRAALLVFPRSA